MPVSVVCDAASVVNAALRESISTNSSSSSSNTTNCSTQHHQHNNIQNNNNNVQNNSNNNATINNNNNNRNNNQNNDDDNTDNGQQNLQNKLIASTKRILLTKIEYEEVNNYSQTVLDTLKTKYIILKPINNNNNNGKINNQSNTNSPMITLSSSPSLATVTVTSKGDGGDDKEITHQNSSTTTLMQNAIPVQQNGIKDPNQLPQPKCILFPRENVQIGWKNSNRKWLIGAGMANVGNTCYLNSILQALFHVPAMANWLISDIQHREQCEIENGIQNSNCIICSVARTLIASQSNQPIIRPFLIYTKLKLVCKHLILGRQEDAHEFLRYLVESMEKSYLSRFRNWKELDQYSKETTPLNQILGGYLRSTVRCLACGHISTTFQHFQDLLVDIRKADTVEDALAGFFSRERLEDMGYKCEACKKKVSATKQFSLERAPISLCIQLKRFSMLGTKLNKPVTFRTRLDLSPYASRKSNNNSNGYNNNQLTYRLVSMVIHLGTSQHCGHYTTVALTDAGGYYQFDDSSVRAASLQSVLVTNGYIMFYEIEDPRQKGQHYSSLPSTITSTKVSGEHSNTSEQIKENLQHKINGHHNNNENINSLSDICNGLSPVPSSTSTTSSSIIGPQLPDKLLNGYKSSSESQKSKINSNIGTTTHHKLVNSPTTSKLVKTSLNNETSSTSSSLLSLSIKTTTTALSQSSPKLKCNTNQTLNNKLVIHFKNTNNINGSNPLNTKFQGINSPTKGQLNDSNKIQTENSKNSKKSLVTIPSTSNTASKSSLLPSMPNLENSTQKSNNSPLSLSPSSSLVRYPSANKTSPGTNATATTGNASNNSNSNNLTNRRSLVPYESDDESSGNNSDSEQQQQQRNTNSKNLPNNSTIPSTNGNNKNNGDYLVLDENSSSSTSSTTSTSKSPGVAKTPKTPPSPAIVKSKAGLWQVTKANVERANTVNSSTLSSSSSPNAKTKTPSSPLPLTTSTITTKITEKRNPFATESSLSAISTSNFYSSSSNNSSSIKLNNGGGKDNKNKFNKKHEGGYTENHNNTNGNTVNQLLKYSHRGYGAPVLSWNGQKPEMEKEIDEQIRLERKREIIDDEENEMDRGRQKKVKTHNNRDNSHGGSNGGYNPFQEYQNNQPQQRRWNNNGNNGNNSNCNNNNNTRYHGQNGNVPHIRQNNSNNPFYRNNNNNNFRNNHHHNNNHNHHRRFNNNHHQRPHNQRNGGGDNNRFHHRRDS